MSTSIPEFNPASPIVPIAAAVAPDDRLALITATVTHRLKLCVQRHDQGLRQPHASIDCSIRPTHLSDLAQEIGSLFEAPRPGGMRLRNWVAAPENMVPVERVIESRDPSRRLVDFFYYCKAYEHIRWDQFYRDSNGDLGGFTSFYPFKGVSVLDQGGLIQPIDNPDERFMSCWANPNNICPQAGWTDIWALINGAAPRKADRKSVV